MVSQISKSNPQAPAQQSQRDVQELQARKPSPPKEVKTGADSSATSESSDKAQQARNLKAGSGEGAARVRARREAAVEANQKVSEATQIKAAYKVEIESQTLNALNEAANVNEREKVKAAAAQADAFDQAVAEAEQQIDAAKKVAAAAEVVKVENREADAALTMEREAESAYQNQVAMGRLSDRRDLVKILRAAVEEGSEKTAEARTLARANRDLAKMQHAVVRQEEEMVQTILDKLEIAEEQIKKSQRVVTGTRPHQTTEGAFEENSDNLGGQDKTLGLVPLAFRATPEQNASGAFSDRNEPVIEPGRLDLSDDASVEAIQASIQEAQTRVASFQEEAEVAAAQAEKRIKKAAAALEEKRTSPAIGNAEEARRLAETVAKHTAEEPERMIATQRFITTQSALQVLN